MKAYFHLYIWHQGLKICSCLCDISDETFSDGYGSVAPEPPLILGQWLIKRSSASKIAWVETSWQICGFWEIAHWTKSLLTISMNCTFEISLNCKKIGHKSVVVIYLLMDKKDVGTSTCYNWRHNGHHYTLNILFIISYCCLLKFLEMV